MSIILNIDVVIMSNAKNKNLQKMTENAIESINDVRCNIIVLEQQNVKYNCKTYRIKEPFNFNGEANHAMNITKNEYVVISNNDVIFKKGWYDELFKGDITGVMSTHSPNDFRQKDLKKDIYGYQIGYNFSGWCFCISRKTWETIGGFDEDFPFWCSDDSFMEQCKMHNIKNILKHKCIVHHIGSQTLRTVNNYNELTKHQLYKFKEKYNKMEKVSIIIPCYNYGIFLGDAIESALNQTYPNVEVIVVNDGSTDNTVEVAKIYNINLINTHNRCVSAARNTGIEHSTGEYIVCLDADDKLDPEYVSDLIKHMKDYDIVGTWAKIFGDRNETLTYDNVKIITHAMLRHKNYIHTSAMFKKILFDKYGGFDEQLLKGYEDWEYWRRLAKNGAKIMIYHKSLLFYRKHGITRNDVARNHSKELIEYINQKDNGNGIDVVIPLGKGSTSANNELRFCLRSIEQYLEGYRNIWIIGPKPKFLKNVNHILHDEYHPKSNNIYDKIKRACNTGEISDNFILFNDDYFLVEKVDAPTYPNYFSNEALKEVYQRPKPDPYRQMVEDTEKVLGKAWRYADIHCPIVINKKAFLSQPYKRNTEHGLLVKSTYLHWSGLPMIERQDPILRKPHTKEQIEAMLLTTDMISIHDEAINNDFIEWIEGKFPYHSRYEI